MRQTYSPDPDPDPFSRSPDKDVLTVLTTSSSLLRRLGLLVVGRRCDAFGITRLTVWGLVLLLSLGAFHVRVSPQELEARRKDLRWFELYCTKDYIAAHPWTPEELAGTTRSEERRVGEEGRSR